MSALGWQARYLAVLVKFSSFADQNRFLQVDEMLAMCTYLRIRGVLFTLQWEQLR